MVGRQALEDSGIKIFILLSSLFCNSYLVERRGMQEVPVSLFTCLWFCMTWTGSPKYV